MLTVTQLAKQFGISRTTILYYERAGLLTPAHRSGNDYRKYGKDEIARLEMILAYRSFGLPVANILELLTKDDKPAQDSILCEQFKALEDEIQKLRKQQNAIVKLLERPDLLKEKTFTIEQWTEIMRASGMDDDDMHNWHRQFETMKPEAHKKFLESLSIDDKEVARIREWSRM